MAFEELAKRLDRIGESAAKRMAFALKLNDGNASGELATSIKSHLTVTGNSVGFYIDMLDYWEYASFGRKAGRMPPVDKIKEWLTYPDVKSKIGSGEEFNVTNIDSVNSRAWAIAKKIEREGTEGSHFTDVVFDNKAFDKELEKAITDSLGLDVELLLDEVFNIE